MAKKKKNVESFESASVFSGGLLSLIGCFIMMALVVAIMVGVGAFLATMNVIKNENKLAEDLANPVNIALFYSAI